jgi:GxxExxY protein
MASSGDVEGFHSSLGRGLILRNETHRASAASTTDQYFRRQFVHSIAKQAFWRRCRRHMESVPLACRACSVAKACYEDLLFGGYFAGVLVNDVLLGELNAGKALDDAHRMQCANYLKATDLQLCLLLNFGKPRLEIKHVAHGLLRAPVHLGVLRASPCCYCAKIPSWPAPQHW